MPEDCVEALNRQIVKSDQPAASCVPKRLREPCEVSSPRDSNKLKL
jgi:hypothetical protein